MEAPSAAAIVEQPTPAPVAAPVADERPSPLADLKDDAERQAWDRDGKLPDRLKGWKAPAATPETPAPAADATDDAVDAAGQPVKDAQGRPLSRRAAEAERRTREAIERASAGTRAELEAARRELAALRQGQPPAAQPPTPPSAAAADDKEPTLEDFLDQPDPYLALNNALIQRGIDKALKAERAARAAESRQTAEQADLQQRVQTYQERETAFKATVPDFDTRTAAFRQIIDVTDPIGRSIVASDVAPQLILHLAERPDVVRRIGALAQTDLPAALRVLWTEEQALSPAASAASAQPAAAPPKTVSDAPPIGTTLGSQPAAAADASRAAVARKDFAAFDELETAKDLARLRRR